MTHFEWKCRTCDGRFQGLSVATEHVQTHHEHVQPPRAGLVRVCRVLRRCRHNNVQSQDDNSKQDSSHHTDNVVCGEEYELDSVVSVSSEDEDEEDDDADRPSTTVRPREDCEKQTRQATRITLPVDIAAADEDTSLQCSSALDNMCDTQPTLSRCPSADAHNHQTVAEDTAAAADDDSEGREMEDLEAGARLLVSCSLWSPSPNKHRATTGDSEDLAPQVAPAPAAVEDEQDHEDCEILDAATTDHHPNPEQASKVTGQDDTGTSECSQDFPTTRLPLLLNGLVVDIRDVARRGTMSNGRACLVCFLCQRAFSSCADVENHVRSEHTSKQVASLMKMRGTARVRHLIPPPPASSSNSSSASVGPVQPPPAAPFIGPRTRVLKISRMDLMRRTGASLMCLLCESQFAELPLAEVHMRQHSDGDISQFISSRGRELVIALNARNAKRSCPPPTSTVRPVPTAVRSCQRRDIGENTGVVRKDTSYGEDNEHDDSDGQMSPLDRASLLCRQDDGGVQCRVCQRRFSRYSSASGHLTHHSRLEVLRWRRRAEQQAVAAVVRSLAAGQAVAAASQAASSLPAAADRKTYARADNTQCLPSNSVAISSVCVNTGVSSKRSADDGEKDSAAVVSGLDVPHKKARVYSAAGRQPAKSIDSVVSRLTARVPVTTDSSPTLIGSRNGDTDAEPSVAQESSMQSGDTHLDTCSDHCDSRGEPPTSVDEECDESPSSPDVVKTTSVSEHTGKSPSSWDGCTRGRLRVVTFPGSRFLPGSPSASTDSSSINMPTQLGDVEAAPDSLGDSQENVDAVPCQIRALHSSSRAPMTSNKPPPPKMLMLGKPLSQPSHLKSGVRVCSPTPALNAPRTMHARKSNTINRVVPLSNRLHSERSGKTAVFKPSPCVIPTLGAMGTARSDGRVLSKSEQRNTGPCNSSTNTVSVWPTSMDVNGTAECKSHSKPVRPPPLMRAPSLGVPVHSRIAAVAAPDPATLVDVESTSTPRSSDIPVNELPPSTAGSRCEAVVSAVATSRATTANSSCKTAELSSSSSTAPRTSSIPSSSESRRQTGTSCLATSRPANVVPRPCFRSAPNSNNCSGNASSQGGGADDDCLVLFSSIKPSTSSASKSGVVRRKSFHHSPVVSSVSSISPVSYSPSPQRLRRAFTVASTSPSFSPSPSSKAESANTTSSIRRVAAPCKTTMLSGRLSLPAALQHGVNMPVSLASDSKLTISENRRKVNAAVSSRKSSPVSTSGTRGRLTRSRAEADLELNSRRTRRGSVISTTPKRPR